MARTSIVVTRRDPVYVTHICSHCGYPMITTVSVDVRAEKSYTFSQTNAEEIANETADNAVDKEIKRIEACYVTKQPLVEKDTGRDGLGMSLSCTSFISGFASHCPMCRNLEPWKSASAKKKMEELKKENFPVVFRYTRQAENWAFGLAKAAMATIDEQRKDPTTIEHAIEELIEGKVQIWQWKQQMDNMPEQSVYEKLREELWTVRSQKASLGLLDRKAKKLLDKKIAFLEEKIKNAKNLRDQKLEPISLAIIDLNNKLRTTQAVAFGCTGKYTRKECGNALVYTFSPNKIPDEVMEEIDNRKSRLSHELNDVVFSELEHSEKHANNTEIAYCRKCGFKLLPNSAFCTKCGSIVDA